MIQLNPENYCKLFDPLSKLEINHLFAKAVLEQKMDGSVYVDDPGQPSTFYVKHRYGMSLLFGKTDNDDFNRHLASYLLNHSGSRKTNEWLQVFPDEWSDKLIQLVGGNMVNPDGINPEKHQIIKWSRVNFRFCPAKYASVQSIIPEGFTLIRTSAEMFGKISGSVIPSFFWRNGQEFAENAVGFSLLYNDQPVSTAFASFIHGQQLEIGIETKTEFRGKKLAQITASAIIDYCLENNFEPIWSCRLENNESYILAQKLGFELTTVLPYYQLPSQAFVNPNSFRNVKSAIPPIQLMHRI